MSALLARRSLGEGGSDPSDPSDSSDFTAKAPKTMNDTIFDGLALSDLLPCPARHSGKFKGLVTPKLQAKAKNKAPVIRSKRGRFDNFDFF